MTKSKIAWAAAAVALCSIPAAAQDVPCNNTPAYTPCELVFELPPAAGADAYTHVDLKAEFRSPRERTFAVPGYWDGGRRMVVRIAPTMAGEWLYQTTSNIESLNDKTGKFTAVESDAPGFVVPANMHHWSYTEKQKPHLWMGATDLRFAFEDDAAFRSMADARAAEKFNHLRGWVMSDQDAAYTSAGQPDVAQFQRLDQRVRYLNQKGVTVDLILAGGSESLTRNFPSESARKRFAQYVTARYQGMNVTWQAVEIFEDYPDARARMNEIGQAIKDADGYHHPITTGARVTSSPLLDDKWMNYIAAGSLDDSVNAIEHQLYPAPFVGLRLGDGKMDAAAERARLWNATMDGQYPTMSGANPATIKAMTAWFDVMSGTRHWELEPYFDVDGGRALALDEVEYLVYVEKPGPLELTVAQHGYDVFWINPATGESTRAKKYSGTHFTGEPPDRSHDWVLHVVREGTLQSMNRSYKFESVDVQLQEVEVNPDKTPFEIVQPDGEISLAKPAPYAVKVIKNTRATRSMMYLWTGEITADHQGFRVLATGAQGTFQATPRLGQNFPATLLVRVYGMNANGKVYFVTKGLTLTR